MGGLLQQASGRWKTGWTLGAAVVAIAAGLLLAIISLGRRITNQASEIEAALDGARESSTALFDLTTTNAALERATGHLRTLREPGAAE